MTEPATPDATIEVKFDPLAGYVFNPNDGPTIVPPDLASSPLVRADQRPDPTHPSANQWWCVVTEEGLGTIFGPYLTEAAAQSFLDEGSVTGAVQQMRLS